MLNLRKIMLLAATVVVGSMAQANQLKIESVATAKCILRLEIVNGAIQDLLLTDNSGFEPKGYMLNVPAMKQQFTTKIQSLDLNTLDMNIAIQGPTTGVLRTPTIPIPYSRGAKANSKFSIARDQQGNLNAQITTEAWVYGVHRLTQTACQVPANQYRVEVDGKRAAGLKKCEIEQTACEE